MQCIRKIFFLLWPLMTSYSGNGLSKKCSGDLEKISSLSLGPGPRLMYGESSSYLICSYFLRNFFIFLHISFIFLHIWDLFIFSSYILHDSFIFLHIFFIFLGLEKIPISTPLYRPWDLENSDLSSYFFKSYGLYMGRVIPSYFFIFSLYIFIFSSYSWDLEKFRSLPLYIGSGTYKKPDLFSYIWALAELSHLWIWNMFLLSGLGRKFL